jgi:beta-glucanase (GH16 family)
MMNDAFLPLVPSDLLVGNYQPAAEFSDEFDGSILDSGKWYDFAPMWLGRAPGFFDRDNVRVRDGRLRLTARALAPDEVSVENRARKMDRFSTAFVRSCNRIRYGYFETRFRAMRACVCNAFWLNDPLDPPEKYRPGDHSEEIDMFEVFGRSAKRPELSATPAADRVFWMTLHRVATPYVETKVYLDHWSASGQAPVDESFAECFHTAGFLWTPEKLVWLLDGRVVWEQENAFCHRPLFLNIDCEIMAAWVGEPDPADLPAEFELEYVRVWQLADAP